MSDATPSERRILSALRDLGGEASPSQISAAAGMPYPTVRVGLQMLIARGLVQRVAHGRYALVEGEPHDL